MSDAATAAVDGRGLELELSDGEREGNERENTLKPCHIPSSCHPLCG